MKIQELRSESRFRNIAKTLNRNLIKQYLNLGYHFHPVHKGEGGYGSIMQHDSVPYVIKLFDVTDTAYVKFIQLVRSHHSNPHFPKFRGQVITLSDQVLAIRLEKLTPWSKASYEDMEYLLYQAQSDPDWRRHLDRNPIAQEFMQTWPQFGLALDVLNKFILQGDHEITFDWHDGNIMQRSDGTPVIIDPFAPAA